MSDDSRTVQTTIGDLAAAEPALKRLAALRLDAKTRYHVVKLAKLVSAETQEHFYDPRLELFRELGVERDPTAVERARKGPERVIEIPTAKAAEFNARLKELSAVPVSLPWGPVLSTMLENTPEFTAADMMALGPLFTLVDVEPSQGG